MALKWKDRCKLWLPMTAECHDPTRGRTDNVGAAGGELHGVFGGGIATPTKIGSRGGYYFDGGNNMQCSAGYQLTTARLSVMHFFRITDVSLTRVLFGWETVGGDMVCQIRYATGELQAFMGTFGVNQSSRIVGANWGIESGVHTHVAVWDGTNNIGYIDGQYGAAAATPDAPDATSNPMYVGVRGDGASAEWVGDIYHVGMADFALSPEMVRDYHISMLQEHNKI